MTVQEWFEGDQVFREDVENMADESEYSAKASAFVMENWERDAESLSEKQATWAGRILDDMVERRIDKQRRSR